MLERAANDPRQRLITFMGGTWEEAKQNYIDASPNLHIDKHTPPLCFMDGEFDRPGERYIATIPSSFCPLNQCFIGHWIMP